MREKILTFLSLTDFDNACRQSIGQVVGQFRSGFENGFGQTLPPEPAEALALVKRAHEDRRSAFEAAVVKVYEQHFSEAEIDALITFYQSHAGQRLVAVGDAVQTALTEARGAWSMDAIQSVEPDLARLLGVGGDESPTWAEATPGGAVTAPRSR